MDARTHARSAHLGLLRGLLADDLGDGQVVALDLACADDHDEAGARHPCADLGEQLRVVRRHYEVWTQPDGARTVLTKPKVLTVKVELEVKEGEGNSPTRYILRAAAYSRLVDAVKEA